MSKLPAFLLALTSAALVACSSTPDAEPAGATPSAAPERAEASDPSIAPRPFRADEIRDANPPGTVLVFRLTPTGQPVTYQHFEFHDTDGETVRMSGRTTDADGALLQSDPSASVTWIELRDHATFPAESTVVVDSEVEVPAGRFACRSYAVTRAPGQVETFHFAPERPGPPVLMTVEAGGAEVFRMELFEARHASGT